jgi:hypothetical protein
VIAMIHGQGALFIGGNKLVLNLFKGGGGGIHLNLLPVYVAKCSGQGNKETWPSPPQARVKLHCEAV